ncbi:MAG: hypothetical protein CMH57_01170 [Myxococcales bacterium]|nr:hypothetical protein [Myxococcales bacterium]
MLTINNLLSSARHLCSAPEPDIQALGKLLSHVPAGPQDHANALITLLWDYVRAHLSPALFNRVHDWAWTRLWLPTLCLEHAKWLQHAQQEHVLVLGGEPDFSLLPWAIESGETQPRMALTQAPLSAAHLYGVALPFARLDQANLENANLEHADLDCATLIGANLKGANLRSCYLTNAHLDQATLRQATLAHASVVCTRFEAADLSEVHAPAADFRHAKMTHARLSNAQLQDANLSGADLQGAELRHTDLRGANLSHVGWKGADLRGSDLRGAQLTTLRHIQAERAETQAQVRAFEEGELISFQTILLALYDNDNEPEDPWAGALYDQMTQWPQGFDPLEHSLVLAE